MRHPWPRVGDVSAPVEHIRFAVVDVETSGLSFRRDNVLQVGVVIVTGGGQVLDRWSSLVAPRSRWWFRVGPTKLHGIRRRDVRGASPATQVLSKLASSLTGTRFVAHNASFDTQFLHKAAARTGVELRIDQPICTLQLSRNLDPQRTMRHRLADLCTRYGVTLIKPHDALADAEATAAILPHLLAAHHVTTGDELDQLLIRIQNLRRGATSQSDPTVGLDQLG